MRSSKSILDVVGIALPGIVVVGVASWVLVVSGLWYAAPAVVAALIVGVVVGFVRAKRNQKE